MRSSAVRTSIAGELLGRLHAFADTEFRQVFVVSHTRDVV
jgi:hypothetical protein